MVRKTKIKTRGTSSKTSRAKGASAKSVKRSSFGEIYRKYLRNEVPLTRYEKVGIFCFVVVVAGFVGWLYETLLVFGETGHFYMRGGNFLPWINIYAIGALLILPATKRIRRNPLLVFLVSALVSGAVELFAGWLIYTTGDGARFWNYDHGLWAVGSINGFVSPLSVSVFGVLALILVYAALPTAVFLAKRMTKRAFLIVMISVFALFMIDEIGGAILKNTGHPYAVEFYQSHGIEY